MVWVYPEYGCGNGDPGVLARVVAVNRYRALIGVHLVLLDGDGRVLLGRRRDTGFGDGLFHVPAGHVEVGESAVTGLIREAREEVGVEIDAPDVEFAHVLHSAERVQMFFTVRRWRGVVANREPEKCSELRWFDPRALPAEMVEYCRAGLGQVLAGRVFSEFGWD